MITELTWNLAKLWT